MYNRQLKYVCRWSSFIILTAALSVKGYFILLTNPFIQNIKSFIFHQIAPLGAISDDVKCALMAYNRAGFLPAASRCLAYADSPIILKRRCELPLYALALILEALKIPLLKTDYRHDGTGHDDNGASAHLGVIKTHATVVSAGSGFSANLLSSLCDQVEAFESDSVLFTRLIDTCRHNSKINPVTTMTHDKSDVIFIDGGACETISPAIIQKMKVGGKLAIVMPVLDSVNSEDQVSGALNTFKEQSAVQSLHSSHTPLSMPLCNALIFQKNADESLGQEPQYILQLHCPLRPYANYQK